MSGEKKAETSAELSVPPLMSDSSIKVPQEDMGKDGKPSESSSSEQSVCYPPTSCYDYYYPQYNGTFAQSDDKGYYNTGYYVPSYGSYASEAFPCYTYDSTYAGTASKSGSAKSITGQSGLGKSNGFNEGKTKNNLSSKASAFPFNSKSQQPVSHFSRPVFQNQSLNQLNKLSSGLTRGQFRPAGKFSSYTNGNPGVYTQYGPLNYQSNGRIWNNNYRNNSRENFDRNGDMKTDIELTRGPRANNRNNSSKAEQLGFAVEREKYNLPDFQTEYDNAKFYVIKSYSEDNIHKCIKYDVWSSTPNGNKKLDAAFREADAKYSETGIKCPIFLFFSVNGSGQFVGVAEMIGPVDLSKNMDFWKLDKWTGFFPIKWDIIKDVPNAVLRHIILENNENRAVTYSRDTQEIELKHGLEMLSIFKSYSEKTSVLDDFNFYENREKALKAKKNGGTAPQSHGFRNGDHEKHFGSGEESAKSGDQSDPSSLISLTKNLSLNSQPLRSGI